jgi:tRNA modification GTPase
VAVCEAGARLAEPGEFTLRAFLAGRIDLTQAEAVLGVVDARGESDLQISLAQLAGGLARPMQCLREQLLQLLAELEVGLDFVDEDIEFISHGEVVKRLEVAAQMLNGIAKQAASRLTNDTADEVVLIGPPNVGKSRLFNALVDRCGERESHEPSHGSALVSSMRGTTRDYLTSTLMLDGVRFVLVDTAGIGNVGLIGASIDSLAQELTSERRTRAAIRVWCSEISQPLIAPADCDLIVLTKSDLQAHPRDLTDSARNCVHVVVTSSQTGAGLDKLCLVLRRLLVRESARPAPIVATTAQRCQASMRRAETALRRAAHTAAIGGGEELVAVEVRSALVELGNVVGSVYTDEILDRIFSSFCIGK